MRLPCPLCGDRDLREFSFLGAADYLDRPGAEAEPAAWDAYLHLRSNPAGPTEDLWFHGQGCGAWLKVSRDTLTHEVHGSVLARDAVLGREAGDGEA